MKKAERESTCSEILNIGNEVLIVAVNTDLVKRVFTEKIRERNTPAIEKILAIRDTLESFCNRRETIDPIAKIPIEM